MSRKRRAEDDVPFDALDAKIRQRVIGTGGFGCVIWPAIVFANEKTVTQSTAQMYVTKLADDASQEYDIAMEIKSRAPNCGIYPVDSLQCGLQYSDLAPFMDEATRTCAKQLRKYIGERPLRSTIMHNYVPTQPYGSIYGGHTLCAIQYPKYSDTLLVIRDFDRTHPKKREFVYKIYDKLTRKLTKLHNNNIVHLDIKLTNMCVLNSEPYFADWGLTFVFDATPSIDDVSNCARTILNRSSYYCNLMENEILLKEMTTFLDKLGSLHIVDYPTSSTALVLIKSIDQTCFTSAMKFLTKSTSV